MRTCLSTRRSEDRHVLAFLVKRSANAVFVMLAVAFLAFLIFRSFGDRPQAVRRVGPYSAVTSSGIVASTRPSLFIRYLIS